MWFFTEKDAKKRQKEEEEKFVNKKIPSSA